MSSVSPELCELPLAKSPSNNLVLFARGNEGYVVERAQSHHRECLQDLESPLTCFWRLVFLNEQVGGG